MIVEKAETEEIWFRYPKIYSHLRSEVDGILGWDQLYIEEKIDGAQCSLFNQDDKIYIASRNLVKGPVGMSFGTKDKSHFESLSAYVDNNDKLKLMIKHFPSYIFYGEWLARHTIEYYQDNMHKFYLYDIYDKIEQKWLKVMETRNLAEYYGIPRPHLFYPLPDSPQTITIELMKEFVGQSKIGKKGEGIVIKTDNFINKFGDKAHAKIVQEKFKETNKIYFGGNDRSLPNANELQIMNKYVTGARIRKILHKLKDTGVQVLNFSATPKVVRAVYYDVMQENFWEIVEMRKTLNFKEVRSLCSRRIIVLYKEMVTETPEEWKENA